MSGPRIRRESELVPPVRRHLEAAGYTVWVDPDGSDFLDIVAERVGEVGLVELKLADWRTLLRQAVARRGFGDWVAVALPRRTLAEKLLRRAQGENSRRVGVWSVADGRVEELRAAEPWPPETREAFPGLREELRVLLELRASGLAAPEVRWGGISASAGRRAGGRSAAAWRLEEFPSPTERSD